MIVSAFLALAGSLGASLRSSLHAMKSPTAPHKENANQAQPNQPAQTESQPAPLAIGPIDRNVIAGGGGASSGGNFRLAATAGEAGASDAQTGGSFQLNPGFWNTLSESAAVPTPSPTPTATPTPAPTATPTPTPTPTPSPSPVFPIQLLLDSSGPDPEQAAALDSVLLLRDPFPAINEFDYFAQPAHRNTRIILFAGNLSLQPGESPSTVIVHLTDANNLTYDLLAEDVRQVPNFSFVQVLFRLPDNLAPGRSTVRIELHNQISNSGTFRIRP